MQNVIREMLVKTTVSNHFIPIRISKIQSQRASIEEDVEKLKLVHCLWKCKMLQLLWKTVWHFLKGTVIIWPGISIPRCTSRKINMSTQKLVHSVYSNIIITINMEISKCLSMDEWICKMWDNLYNEILPCPNKHEILIHATAWKH